MRGDDPQGARRGGAWLLAALERLVGRLALGAGESRIAGQFKLRVLSPAFAGDWRAIAVVDGNILTASDTGDLYYFWYVGLERGRLGLIYGGWFYHRSNHQLAEPGDRVTSINVLEAGVETDDWKTGSWACRWRTRRPRLGRAIPIRSWELARSGSRPRACNLRSSATSCRTSRSPPRWRAPRVRSWRATS